MNHCKSIFTGTSIDKPGWFYKAWAVMKNLGGLQGIGGREKPGWFYRAFGGCEKPGWF